MICISVRVRDCTGKLRYNKLKKEEDKLISQAEFDELWEKIEAQVRLGAQPEIKYEIQFNRYLGCVAGMSGVWTRMIDTVRARRILEHTVSQINTAVANNQKQLGIGQAV